MTQTVPGPVAGVPGPSSADAKIAAGETIRWRGRAPRGVRGTRRDLLYVPFWLVYALLVTGFEYLAIRGHHTFFAIFAAPFALLAVHGNLTRWFVDAWFREQTWYLVTDRAAYVVRLAPFAWTCRHAGRGLTDVSVAADRHGGGGSILFPRRSLVGDSAFAGDDIASPVSFAPTPTYGDDGGVFDAVPDVAAVAALVAAAYAASLDANGEPPRSTSPTT